MSEIPNIKTETPTINIGSISTAAGPAYNQGVVSIKNDVSSTEEVSLENLNIEEQGAVKTMDFTRIAISSDRALSGNFVSEDKIDKNFWDIKRMTYQKNEYGSYTLFRDGKPVGYTDEVGISGITPIKEEVTIENSDTKVHVNTVEKGETANESQTVEGIRLEVNAPYNSSDNPLTRSKGKIEFNGHIETFYSQRVLPGEGLDIPGRHVADDGTIRDGQGFISVASGIESIKKGDILMTSLGPAKVYDFCETPGIIDIYVDW